MNVIGIDVGGSTTKIIGVSGEEWVNPLQVTATDPVTSIYGAFGRYMCEAGLQISDISCIKITGVGADHVKDNIYGIPTQHVDEFRAIGLGGQRLSGLKKAIIVSMGTGTAFIRADGREISHMGGTGVGGGTLIGLSGLLLGVRNFESIIELARTGDLNNVDISIGDMNSGGAYMPANVTASNFGKVTDFTTKSDMAAGLVNMVFQTIGMMSVFASRIDGIRDVALCGNLTTIPNTKEIFSRIEELHGVRFTIPPHAEYATALGAALA